MISKTHHGTVQLFYDNFIKNNKVDKKYARNLMDLLDGRIEADYDALAEFTYKEAKEAYKKAVGFVNEVKKLV